MIHLSFNQKFVLTFKVKKSQLKSIQILLNENGFDHESWVRTPFDNFVEFRISCTLLKASVIRNLLKHHFYE